MPDSPSPSRVLIVDDDRHIARLVEFVLNKHGYLVHSVYDGASALKALDDFEPTAVVLDLMLPDMLGTEVLSGIRRHPKCCNCGVLLLSAHTFESGGPVAPLDSLTLQATKPIAPTRLVEKIRELSAILGGPGGVDR